MVCWYANVWKGDITGFVEIVGGIDVRWNMGGTELLVTNSRNIGPAYKLKQFTKTKSKGNILIGGGCRIFFSAVKEENSMLGVFDSTNALRSTWFYYALYNIVSCISCVMLLLTVLGTIMKFKPFEGSSIEVFLSKIILFQVANWVPKSL